ncbi:MAG: hypothetical protein PHF60_05750 [Candidatus ainarchaeum sp.]|nr:hypothetical protein [Candidatus ainarchaeum sp.]
MAKLLMVGEKHTSPNIARIGGLVAERTRGIESFSVLVEGGGFPTPKSKKFDGSNRHEIAADMMMSKVIEVLSGIPFDISRLESRKAYLLARGLKPFESRMSDLEPLFSTTMVYSMPVPIARVIADSMRRIMNLDLPPSLEGRLIESYIASLETGLELDRAEKSTDASFAIAYAMLKMPYTPIREREPLVKSHGYDEWADVNRRIRSMVHATNVFCELCEESPDLIIAITGAGHTAEIASFLGPGDFESIEAVFTDRDLTESAVNVLKMGIPLSYLE